MTREDIIRMAREAEDYADTIYQKGEYHPGWLEVRDQRFAALVATTEKQKVVEYMNSRAFATGHGDTIEDLLKEMEWQVAEREREACKKLAQEHAAEYRVGGRLYAPLGENYALCAAVACDHIVHLIEERGRK